MNKCNNFADYESDLEGDGEVMVQKVRIINARTAKPIMISSESTLANLSLSQKKKRTLKIDDDEDDDLDAAEILTKVSTSYVQSFASRANSTFSG